MAELEWTVNAYNLSFAVLLLTAAALGDRLGRRRLLAAGVGGFVLASAACALAPSAGALIAARALQGAGAAFVMTLGFTLVSRAFPPERRGSALGIYFAVTGVAVATGPLVGGAVTEGIDWPWIFWLNVPLGLILIPFVLARMEESRGPDVALDLPGLVLATVGLLGIMWALVRANDAAWTSLEVVATMAGGLALLAAFVFWQLRAPGRCCRCACSPTGPSPRATARSSSPSERCSAACSSWRSSSRPRSASGRSTPGCVCCRGRRRCSSSRRSPARRWTASANGRSSSPARCCRRSAWAGSPSSPMRR